jgi:hypothetical protein
LPFDSCAIIKSNLIALACPICKYPFGSGGNLVKISCPYSFSLFSLLSFVFIVENNSLPIQSLNFSHINGNSSFNVFGFVFSTTYTDFILFVGQTQNQKH